MFLSTYLSKLLVVSTWAVLLAHSSTALPLLDRHEFRHSSLRDAAPSLSAGGKAICITGTIPVNVSTSANSRLLYSDSGSQFAVTQTFADYLSANSSLPLQVYGGEANVSGIFNINAKLCYPVDWAPKKSSKAIQFLIHGIGFDKSYWDFAEGFSYVDNAAAAGYPTFSYDRLGVGASDHPDPIQIVQAPLQVEVAHSLIQSLRDGTLAGHKFHHVVGVGHSFGSIQSVGITASYPKDFDAVVLTGFSISTNGLGVTIADFNLAIASQNQPLRFGALPSGYLVTGSAISNQFAFLHYPNFDPSIFAKDDAAKQTVTIGELFTITKPVEPAIGFTGPVDVVLGEYDMIFCQANCAYPSDQSVMVQALYPAASNSSQAHIVPGVGHAINLHFQAQIAFDEIQEFVKSNGF
ncbi:catalytic protein [Lipomyces tetrasporus]|uniref:Catalytic protein n=1 Tax=Lipomyces tetrasporus TaxID=54092 RepID=A0AAD7QXR5_9ASCO|nr:catalytic protein [Lipomyces tetrasporus]KAJ8103423.1 catalytic protein [Lipomyces tetrasporus]